MSEGAWRPLIPTGREDALVETWPGYLRESVFRWMARAVDVSSTGSLSSDRFVDFQRAIRTDIGYRAGTRLSWKSDVLPHLRAIPDDLFTNLVDYLASTFYFRYDDHPLEAELSGGGSAWTVIRWNTAYARLTKRVPDGVSEAMRPVLSASDTASLKLQEAWLDAYGANPRASVAFSHAVVAVETAVLSVIPTSVPEPTLSNVFSTLEADTPRWRLIFRDSERAPGAKTVAAMLRTLWRGHESRHGRPDYADATLEEARAAVILAATLVQWFTSGVVVPTATATTN